jgi:hypothetical protein
MAPGLGVFQGARMTRAPANPTKRPTSRRGVSWRSVRAARPIPRVHSGVVAFNALRRAGGAGCRGAVAVAGGLVPAPLGPAGSPPSPCRPGSYAAYVLHPPVLVALSLLARPLPVVPEVKFVLVAVSGVAAFAAGVRLTRLQAGAPALKKTCQQAVGFAG